jgi:glycogen debranching enzyme
VPGAVRYKLAPGESVHFACSTDPIDPGALFSVDDDRAATGAATGVFAAGGDDAFAALARAAGQFVAAAPQPADSHAARDGAAHAPVSVISHYPWAAPSTRLALIAFPGLFLVTGRHAEGRAFLASLAAQLDGGLLPSEFPEDGSAPLYQGADVSLWFVHAAHQYLRYTGDEAFVRDELFHALALIVHYYRTGTRLGIRPDADGLVATREAGVGTTWMDAGLGGVAVTPRAGMPVELNALWYNAVCVMAELSDRFGESAWAAELTDVARSIKEAFNRRFWNDAGGGCYDVVANDEGQAPDASVRPNQLLAASLPFAVLDRSRHAEVLEKVRAELLTPVGVRTLSPSDPDYHPRYAGNVAARDRAHHNGSAFPWLLGPLVTVHAKVHGRGEKARAEAAEMVRGCLDYLRGDGLGQVCELFDGSAPHAPGGALAAAAAVGELLRCYAEDVAPGETASSAAAPDLELTIRPPRIPHPA